MLGLDNPVHLAFLFVLLLLVFGAKRLPELGHSLGAGMRGFKQAITGEIPTPPLEQATVPAPRLEQASVAMHAEAETAGVAAAER
jgi:sec-independent protein translocase protein TatA